MAAFEDVEKGQRPNPLHLVDSNLTLNDRSRNSSCQPSPYDSRNASTEKIRAEPMSQVFQESAQSTHRYLSQELHPAGMTFILIACFFISGLIDSVAFNTWNCFVGMQTGTLVPVSSSSRSTDK
jgi:hypothetical protein